MSDCCSAPGLMPLAEAKSRLNEAVSAITETTTVSINDALDRVVAENIISTINVPGHNNSAMDGYALCAPELAEDNSDRSEFTQIGTAFAGQPFQGELKPGECIRIMTGAVVPASANAVVMQENVTTNDNQITLTQAAKNNAHIRMAGEDIAIGQVIFNPGHRLNSVDIGLLGSLGIAEINVIRKLRVAVFATGDELKKPGEPLNEGDIYESNSTVLNGLLQRLGAEVIDLGIIKDDKALIEAAFTQADQQADAVISSGGVSVGDADYTKDVLDEIGQIGFWKIAIKPGKPFAFGTLPNSYFFGLPGNPVSATVTFQQLATPVLRKMAGETVAEPLKLTATATYKVKKRPGRTDFQRGIVSTNQQGQLIVEPLSHQGSGVLSSLSKANCYIILPAAGGNVEAGEAVTIELFNNL